MTTADDTLSVEWLPFELREGVRLGRRGPTRIVEWRGIGRLIASPGGTSEFSLEAGAEGSVNLRKFRATSLLACLRYFSGDLSLHGSAVRLPSSAALVMIGDCGAGKSTTAAALVEHERAEFMADDIVPIDWRANVPIVSPVEDTHWLDANSLAWLGIDSLPSEKQALAPRRRAVDSVPLAAIVELVFDDTADRPFLEPLRGQEAFLALSHAQVCYSSREKPEVLQDFTMRSRLAASTPVLRLRRPRRLNALREAARLLVDGMVGAQTLGPPKA
jgi:hypothetical protein